MSQKNDFDNNIIYNDNLKTIKKNYKSKHSFLKFQFIFCTILAFAFTIFYFYSSYEKNKKENISKKLVNNFSITNLYNNNYSTSKLSATNTYETHEDEFKVVGLIEINSISINYPIISRVTNELLKIAPCRFFGPMPNEIRKYVRCWA